MKEREFKKLVFENFIQAKKELIREGYIKKTDNLNFEDVFSETKKKVLEERVKSLQRENQMLKKKLSKRQDLEEAGTMSAARMGKQGGSKLLDKTFRKVGKFFGNPMDKLSDVAMQLNRNPDDYRELLSYISDGILKSDAHISLAITFYDKLMRKGISDSGFESALDRGIEAISSGEQPEGGVFEGRRRY